MRVAVTGGSGVVGRALVRHLVQDGHRVRGLARSTQAAAVLRAADAEPVTGDLLDPVSVEALVAEAEVVFHVAGVNEMCPADPGRMWRVNVEGTAAVVDACRRAGTTRLVHTSSASTLGEGRGEVGTEDTVRRRAPLSEYERSKTEAERLVLSATGDLDVVVVNPASVQGPGRAGGTGALLVAAASGKLPVLVDTTFSIVDIDDCARGHLLAAEKGSPGQRYVLSGAVLTVRQAASLLSRLSGTPRPWFVRPEVLTLVAAVSGGLAKLAGRPTPLCAESARVLLHGHRYDGSRATRELGLEYTPVEDTLRRTLDWFEGLS